MFANVSDFLGLLVAQSGNAPGPGGGCAGDQSSLFLPVVMMAILYFVWILPARKDRKKHQEMIDALKRGDEVITSSGILGTVADFGDGGIVTLEVARNVKIRVLKSAILKKPEAKKEAESSASPKDATTK